MSARRVRLFIATSLDGYIAGPNGEIDWLFTDQDYGYSAFADSIDTVFMGRRSYETSLAFGEWPHPGKETIVFSRRGIAVASPTTVVTDCPPGDVVAGLRDEPGKDFWLLGGGELIKGFLDAGLIDEAVIAVHPIILGDGIPLIPKDTRVAKLILKDQQPYETGLVILSYDVKHQ